MPSIDVHFNDVHTTTTTTKCKKQNMQTIIWCADDERYAYRLQILALAAFLPLLLLLPRTTHDKYVRAVHTLFVCGRLHLYSVNVLTTKKRRTNYSQKSQKSLSD